MNTLKILRNIVSIAELFVVAYFLCVSFFGRSCIYFCKNILKIYSKYHSLCLKCKEIKINSIAFNTKKKQFKIIQFGHIDCIHISFLLSTCSPYTTS